MVIDTHTDRHTDTHTQDNYSNLCAFASRVKYTLPAELLSWNRALPGKQSVVCLSPTLISRSVPRNRTVSAFGYAQILTCTHTLKCVCYIIRRMCDIICTDPCSPLPQGYFASFSLPPKYSRPPGNPWL